MRNAIRARRSAKCYNLILNHGQSIDDSIYVSACMFYICHHTTLNNNVYIMSNTPTSINKYIDI